MWYVVLFPKENTVSAVPSSWFIEQSSECFWPPAKTKRHDLERFIKYKYLPEDCWKPYEAKILDKYDEYSKAIAKSSKAQKKDHLSSTDTEEIGKGKRRKLKTWKCINSDSDADESGSDNSLIFPKLPATISSGLEGYHGTNSNCDSSIIVGSELLAPVRNLELEHTRLLPNTSMLNQPSATAVQNVFENRKSDPHQNATISYLQEKRLEHTPLLPNSSRLNISTTVENRQSDLHQNIISYRQEKRLATDIISEKVTSFFNRTKLPENSTQSLSRKRRLSMEHSTESVRKLQSRTRSRSLTPKTMNSGDKENYNQMQFEERPFHNYPIFNNSQPQQKHLPPQKIQTSSDLILETLQKMQSDSTEFRVQVIRKLNLLNLKINDLENALIKNKEVDTPEELDFKEPSFPLDELKLRNLENILMQDEDYKKILVKYLSRTGGIDVSETVKRLMYKMFTNEIGSLYSWDGAKGKRKFKTLKIASVIMDTVKMNINDCTESQIIVSIKKWLVRCKDRIKNNTKSTADVPENIE